MLLRWWFSASNLTRHEAGSDDRPTTSGEGERAGMGRAHQSFVMLGSRDDSQLRNIACGRSLVTVTVLRWNDFTALADSFQVTMMGISLRICPCQTGKIIHAEQ